MVVHRRGPDTPRLILRAFEVDDAPAFLALNGDPEVMRYTGEPLVESLEAARRAIRDYPDFRVHGFGRWACVHRADRLVIGFAGLKHLDELGEVDLGYRFLPAYWGRGLATEAGRASLDFGFEVLGLERIIALVLPENRASIRVLEKLGMTRVGTAACQGLPADRYEIRRSESVAG